jgi:hypothetical protein
MSDRNLPRILQPSLGLGGGLLPNLYDLAIFVLIASQPA